MPEYSRSVRHPGWQWAVRVGRAAGFPQKARGNDMIDALS